MDNMWQKWNRNSPAKGWKTRYSTDGKWYEIEDANHHRSTISTDPKTFNKRLEMFMANHAHCYK